MAAEQNNAPTMAEQISTFKGSAMEDGVTVSVQDGETPLPEPDDGEEPVGHAPAPVAKPVAKAKSAQERIDQAVKRQREAERSLETERSERKALNDRLDRLERGERSPPLTNQPAATQVADTNAPDPTKFQYGELDPKYLAAVARYETRKEIDAEKATQAEQTRAAQAKTAQTAQAEKLTAFVSKGEERSPGFREDIMMSAVRGEWPLSQTVAELALDSDVGPEILAHLAGDLTEAQRVAALSPAKQAAWFGALEARIPAPSAAPGRKEPSLPVQTTKAPTPPTVRLRGGGNPSPATPDTTDFAAFERLATNPRAH